MQSVSAYGLWVTAAILSSVGLLELRLRRLGTSALERPLVVGSCMLAAGIGGRIHYIAEGLILGWLPTSQVPALLSPMRGGSTFFGAMAGLAVALWLLQRRLPFASLPRLLDEGVWSFGIAILLGRVGCLVQGCCLGRPTHLPWAVAPPAVARTAVGLDAGVVLHPFVMYVGLWGLAAAWLATRPGFGRGWKNVTGSRCLLFVTFFSAGRIGLEWFRLPPPRLLGGLNVAQWEALGVTVIGAIVLSRRRTRGLITPRRRD